MSHTPGPWKAEASAPFDNGAILHEIWGPNYIFVARTCFAPASEANARLIAAAPDLLEACKGVLWLFDTLVIRPNGDHDNPNEDPAYIETFAEFARLRASIAKAEGK